MQAEDLISVDVSVSEAGITRQGFGTTLVLCHHSAYDDRVREYSVNGKLSAALVADGFNTSNPGYRCAMQIAKQRPRPKTIKIGRLTNAETQVVRLTPTAGAASSTRSFTIIGPTGTEYPISFASDSDPTVAEACTALAAAINATSVSVTAVASSTYVECTSDTADRIFTYTDLPSTIVLTDVTAAPADISDALDAILEEDGDWYGIAIASGAPSVIEDVADWVETSNKICLAQTHDHTVQESGSSDICSYIQSHSYTRTRVMVDKKAGEFKGACLLAQVLTYEPGAADWHAKTLPGCTADSFTQAEFGHVYDKDGLTYESVYGASFSSDFQGGGGRFLDVQQVIDWVVQRVKEGFVSARIAAPKIPYTDSGIGATMYGICRNVLAEGIKNTAIDDNPETWSIDVPKVADQATQDRQTRKFPGTEFSFRATGSVTNADVSVNIAS